MRRDAMRRVGSILRSLQKVRTMSTVGTCTRIIIHQSKNKQLSGRCPVHRTSTKANKKSILHKKSSYCCTRPRLQQGFILFGIQIYGHNVRYRNNFST
mmetsp:Transcript_16143/g.33538  ORF Transcript_16143/g.33538 Transcript_16143/m.33538 type:complete len:98 (+) Transcript_16143:854-1147(+)